MLAGAPPRPGGAPLPDMKELDAINLILRVSGNSRVNEVTDGDPKANVARETLTRVRRNILSQPLCFNEGITTLAVGVNNRVVIPKSWLYYRLPPYRDASSTLTWRDVYRDQHVQRNVLCQRIDLDGDNNIYVWNLLENDWHDKEVKDVRYTYDVEDFSQIPDQIAQWIAYEAAVEFHGEFSGADPPLWLEQRRINRRSHALNELQPGTIHDATGFTDLLYSSPTSRNLRAR